MSILSKLLGSTAAEPIEALGNVFDKVFTNDEERMQAEAVLKRISQKPAILNLELNKIEAGHRSIFVAGWRPALGWVCSLGLLMAFIVNPLLERFIGGAPIAVPTEVIMELVIAMLGLATLRTVEKMQGRAK